jgi:hypothetical protein
VVCPAGFGAIGSVNVIAKASILGGLLGSGRADVSLASVEAVQQSMWPVAEILKPNSTRNLTGVGHEIRGLDNLSAGYLGLLCTR